MPTITAAELLEGSEYNLDYKGIKTNRSFLVTVEATEDPTRKMYAAVTCPGLPVYGDLHPTLTNLSVTGFAVKPKPMSNTQMIVTVTYEFDYDHRKSKPSRTGKSTLEFSTVMATSNVYRDANGNGLILFFNDPNNISADNPTGLRVQPATCEIQVPMPLITFRRREPLSGTDYIALKLAYEGHINSRVWNNSATHTWLCTQIEANLSGDAYDMLYQFQFHGNLDPGSWDAIFFFKQEPGDLSPGAPAEDITVQNGGIKIAQVYLEADFTNLGLYF